MQLWQVSHSVILTPNAITTSAFLIELFNLETDGVPPVFVDGLVNGVWLYDELQVPCVHIILDRDIEALYSEQGSQPKELVYLEPNPLNKRPSVNRFSLFSSDYANFKQRLLRQDVKYKERCFDEFGLIQFIIQGPNHLVVEVLFALAELD